MTNRNGKKETDLDLKNSMNEMENVTQRIDSRANQIEE